MRAPLSFGILLLSGCAGAQFGLPDTIAISDGSLAGRMVLLDVDADGLQDVVATWPYWMDGFSAKWSKNLGGGFAVSQLLAKEFGGQHRLISADMDGDQDEDLVGSPYDEAHGFSWHEHTGTGVWPKRPVDTVAYYTPNLSFAVGDLDMDGDNDVVVVREPVHDLGWYANDGDGGFGPFMLIASSIASETESTELTLLDRDNDGDRDLCVVTESIVIYDNNGSGVFGEAYTAPFQLDQTNNPQWTVAEDFDGDGYTDLVIAENGFSTNDRILLHMQNLSGTGFAPDTLLGPLNYYIIGFAAADVDQDGDLDLTVSRSSAPELAVLLNDPAEPTGFAPALTPLVEHGGGSKSILWKDLLGGPAPDVVVCDGPIAAVLVLEQTAPFQFVPHLVNTLVVSPKALLPEDMDGDGIMDLAVLSTMSLGDDDGLVSWFKGEGNGVYGRQRLMNADHAAYSPRDMDTGDLNGDGVVDVVVANAYGAAYMLNTGNGMCDPPLLLNGSGSDVSGVALADMDGDGDLDVLSGDHSATAQVGLYRNDGTAQFGAMEVVVTSPDPGFGLTAVRDMDQDGDVDVLSTSLNADLVLSRNNGAGTFAAPLLLAAGVGGGAPAQPLRFDVRDADQDTDPDVVYVLAGDQTVNLLVNTGGTFTSTLIYAAPLATGVEFAQLDADPEPELVVWQGPLPFHLVVLQRQGDGSYLPQFGFDLPSYVTACELFDMDGDGDDDLVFGQGIEQEAPLVWRENFFLQGALIHGHVFADLDGDGLQDAEDMGIMNYPLQCVPPLTLWLTNDTGAFTAYVDTGSYQISLTDPGPFWDLTTDSALYNVDLETFDEEYAGVSFGLHPIQDVSLIIPSITLGSGVCGTPVPVWLSYVNAGTVIESGLAVLEVDTMVTYLTAEPPTDSTVGQLSHWSFSDLPWFATNSVQATVLNPAAYNLGQTLQLVFTLTTLDELGNVLAIFADTLQQEVTCAIDPNNKQVFPGGYGIHHAVDMNIPYLEYTVRFQNTGTDTAASVTIRDELSPVLDVQTLELIATSHALTACHVGSDAALVFTFDGIDLPDSAADPLGSQGFITFRIRPLAGLPSATVINNTAGIYFDLNEAVITNTTLTTLVDCSQYSATITQVGDGVLVCTPGDAYQWFVDEVPIPGATAQQLFAEVPGSYSVVVTNEFGCALLTDPFTVVGVLERFSSSRRFAVFPNPTTGLVHVVSDKPFSHGTRFEMIDQQGHVVLVVSTPAVGQWVVDLSGFAAGLYTIRAVEQGAVVGNVRILNSPSQ